MSPTSLSLLSLPEELTADVISYLQCHRPTMHALCLTSRACNRITTPYLYTHIYLDSKSFAYFRPLAHLLFISPRHAALVRSIVVRGAYGGNLVPWPVEELELEEALEGVLRGLCAHGEETTAEERVNAFVRSWIKRLKEGGAMEVAGLLVRMLPACSRIGFDGFEFVDPVSKKEREISSRE